MNKQTKKARMVKLAKKAKAIARVTRASKRRLPQLKKPVVVNKVALVPGHVVSISVPPDHTPVVVADHDERRVEIVPVPLPVVRAKRGWWQEMFSPYEE
jgi:hypothetical protein